MAEHLEPVRGIWQYRLDARAVQHRGEEIDEPAVYASGDGTVGGLSVGLRDHVARGHDGTGWRGGSGAHARDGADINVGSVARAASGGPSW
jgi:hypothetical protein